MTKMDRVDPSCSAMSDKMLAVLRGETVIWDIVISSAGNDLYIFD